MKKLFQSFSFLSTTERILVVIFLGVAILAFGSVIATLMLV